MIAVRKIAQACPIGYLQCDKDCDGGVQHRLVLCQDHLGQTVRDVDCRLDDRPADSMKCNTQPCQEPVPKYLWSRSKWSQVG